MQFKDLKQGIKLGGLAIKPITTMPSPWQVGVISQDHRIFHPSHKQRLTLEALEQRSIKPHTFILVHVYLTRLYHITPAQKIAIVLITLHLRSIRVKQNQCPFIFNQILPRVCFVTRR